MALPLSNVFEGGTDGSAITPGNSGGVSGNAFDTVTQSVGTAAPAYSSSSVPQGSLCALFAIGGGGGTSYVEWTSAGAFGSSVTEIYGRVCFNADQFKTTRLVHLLSSGANNRAFIVLTQTGKLQLRDQNDVLVRQLTSTIPTLTQRRVEFHLGPSGAWEVRLFAGVTDTVAAETVGGTGADFGPSFGDVRFGASNTDSAGGAMNLRLDALNLNATAFPGPPVLNVAPIGFSHATAMGAPTVSQAAPTALSVAPLSFTHTVAFGTPSVSSPASLNISPASFTHTAVFGTPTVAAPASLTIAPASFTHTTVFGTAALSGGGAVLVPPSFTHTVAFGAPTVAVAAIPTGFSMAKVNLRHAPVTQVRVRDYPVGA